MNRDDIVGDLPSELVDLEVLSREGANIQIPAPDDDHSDVYPGDIVTHFIIGGSLIQRARLKPRQQRSWANRRRILGATEDLESDEAYKAWIERVRWMRRS